MEPEKIDQKDREIITELISNSRQTVGQLAKKIGMPPTTIHNRIKKLEQHGIIRNYTAEIDYKKLGRPVMAYIGITVNYNVEGRKIKQPEIARQIKKLEGVREVTILTGGLDIIVKVMAKDIDDLNEIVTEKLRDIDGVDKTQTMIVLTQV
ncbi:MAG: Lrp/AsnC family transcriptional regulator [Candidatus Diapherotrites archaeon]|uniref:Lrp/AsnC family transcriptional regulator n=1 Tax=Candidatus Iainarchaeum sp. TaxID=3101447 RepID=A0A8T3YP59_9ARCH|nr:Lrp/AsnC family transcriptional regulator [Candidatus Diapherotrites archaeon]